MDIFIAQLPPGMDPDDVVVKEGPDRLRACLEKPREIFGFLMDALSAEEITHVDLRNAFRARFGIS